MENEQLHNTSPMPEKPHHFATKKVVIISILFLLLAVLAVIGITYTSNKTNDSQSIPTPTQTATSTSPTLSPTNSEGTTMLPPNWKRYTASEAGWQINYPTEVKVNQVPGKNAFGPTGTGTATTFLYIGPTQTEGTELYDGYSVSVGIAQKPQRQTLEQFALEETSSDPVSQRLSFEKITINGLEGYEIIIEGLGTFHQFYLAHPSDENKVLRLSYIAAQPEGQAGSYEDKVQQMVQSLQFSETSSVMCTMDAKICPDGSTVGRVGPNCEFAACPSN